MKVFIVINYFLCLINNLKLTAELLQDLNNYLNYNNINYSLNNNFRKIGRTLNLENKYKNNKLKRLINKETENNNINNNYITSNKTDINSINNSENNNTVNVTKTIEHKENIKIFDKFCTEYDISQNLHSKINFKLIKNNKGSISFPLLTYLSDKDLNCECYNKLYNIQDNNFGNIFNFFNNIKTKITHKKVKDIKSLDPKYIKYLNKKRNNKKYFTNNNIKWIYKKRNN